VAIVLCVLAAGVLGIGLVRMRTPRTALAATD